MGYITNSTMQNFDNLVFQNKKVPENANYFSVAVIDHHGQRQIQEKKNYFGTWFQMKSP